MTQESLWLLSNKTCTILNDAREASLSVAVSSESKDKHGVVHQTELTVYYKQTNGINLEDIIYYIIYVLSYCRQLVKHNIHHVCTVVGYIK